MTRTSILRPVERRFLKEAALRCSPLWTGPGGAAAEVVSRLGQFIFYQKFYLSSPPGERLFSGSVKKTAEALDCLAAAGCLVYRWGPDYRYFSFRLRLF